MKTKYSKEFEKSVRRLSGKTLSSVRNTILDVKNASGLDEITDCKKLMVFGMLYLVQAFCSRRYQALAPAEVGR